MRTPTDQFFRDAQAEDDEVDDAWGAMGEETFFDAPATPALVTPSATFDDGGEPDFAGWLSSQAQAKPKASLPKGLSRPSTSTVANGRPPVTKVTSNGSIDTGTAVKKLATATFKSNVAKPKVIDTKPKGSAVDDDWGDAWD